ncbi:PTS glucose transporter subunit IIA [Streptomyces sp. WAC 05379]|uniref:PTS sugar transporter subunit IIA n=1 Tax=Streptomyces sp. WAC 05379 TaxID=2203207 RepID=UPI0021AD8E16|nr:PTS glucose transporter subunit IIA [Streptomyces sp. WAC 05379]
MSLAVYAPLGGALMALGKVPDPVFAGQLVGSGVAIDPPPAAAEVKVLAPASGTVLKMHPHAFVIKTPDGVGILVHLGIDTVRLEGNGFTPHVAEGDDVQVGQKVITFDAAAVRAAGLSAVCPVVVLDSAPGSAQPPAITGNITTGALLFSWAAS